MRLRTLVLREIFERKSQLLTSFLAILLGITVIVSIKNISYYSEKAVAREMDSLGANVLVLPKSATLAGLLRGRHAGRDDSRGIRHATGDVGPGQGSTTSRPKLSLPVELQGKTFTLTGILPKSEFQAKAAWAGRASSRGPSAAGPRSA